MARPAKGTISPSSNRRYQPSNSDPQASLQRKRGHSFIVARSDEEDSSENTEDLRAKRPRRSNRNAEASRTSKPNYAEDDEPPFDNDGPSNLSNLRSDMKRAIEKMLSFMKSTEESLDGQIAVLRAEKVSRKKQGNAFLEEMKKMEKNLRETEKNWDGYSARNTAAKLREARDECQDLRSQRDEKAKVCGELQNEIEELKGRTAHSIIPGKATLDDHIISLWNELTASITQFIDRQDLQSPEQQVPLDNGRHHHQLRRLTCNPGQLLSQDYFRPLVGQAFVWDVLYEEIFRPGSSIWGDEAGYLLTSLCGELGDIEATDPSRFHELRVFAVSVISSLPLDKTRDTKRISQVLSDSIARMLNTEATQSEEEAALEIIHDAAALDLILRQSRAKFSVQKFYGKKYYGFEYEPELMSLNKWSPGLRDPHSAATVDLIISPLLRKTGNSDGGKYDQTAVLVKSQVLCNAINYGAEIKEEAKAKTKQRGRVHVKPTKNKLPDRDAAMQSVEKETSASGNQSYSRTSETEHTNVVDLTQTTPDTKKTPNKSQYTVHEGNGRQPPMIGSIPQGTSAAGRSGNTGKDRMNQAQDDMTSDTREKDRRSSVRQQGGLHGKDNIENVTSIGAEQTGGAGVAPQDHALQTETHYQGLVGDTSPSHGSPAQGDGKLDLGISESSEKAHHTPQASETGGGSSVVQTTGEETAGGAPSTTTTDSSETLEAEAREARQLSNHPQDIPQFRPSTCPKTEAKEEEDEAENENRECLEASIHEGRAQGDPEGDPWTAREPLLHPGDITKAEMKDTLKGRTNASSKSHRIDKMATKFALSASEAAGRFCNSFKTRAATNVTSGATVSGTGEADVGGFVGLRVTEEDQEGLETQDHDADAKAAETKDEEVDHPIKSEPQDDEVDIVMMLPPKEEVNANDSAAVDFKPNPKEDLKHPLGEEDEAAPEAGEGGGCKMGLD